MRRLALRPCIFVAAAVLIGSGCDSSPDRASGDDGLPSAHAAFSESRAALRPASLLSVRGAHTGDAAALTAADLDGTAHDPAKEVTFTPAGGNYVGEVVLPLPAGTSAAALTDAALDVRFAGPTRAEQRWIWQVRDQCTSRWLPVGNTRAVTSAGTWTTLAFALPVEGACLADAAGVHVRYKTTGTAPSALDALAVTYAAPTGQPSWWRPAPGTSWQWQLTGTLDRSFDVDMYDVDLFETSAADIAALHADGRVVVCYYSAGSYENFRPDITLFPASVIGRKLDDWPGERWIDIRQIDVLAPIMSARLDLAVQKGCDGVEPDNVDGYTNPTGFPLTAADQLAYNRWTAREAHARNLSVGLKNDLDQIPDLVGDYDWALNEQCFQYHECGTLTPFVDAGKAVFGAEYRGETDAFCPQANVLNFDVLKKKLSLSAWRVACR